MSDRLQELFRQRAAIQAHLAWLDREIALASSAEKPAATSTPVSPPTLTAPPTLTPLTASPNPEANAPDPDTLLASYKQDTQNLRTDVRKGCLLYFFGAFLLLGLGIVSFYFVNRLIRQQSDHAPSEQRATPALEH